MFTKLAKIEEIFVLVSIKIGTLLSDLQIPKNILCNISFTFDPYRNHPYYYCDAVFSGEMYSIAVMTSLASAGGVITPTVDRLVQTTGTPGLQDTGLMSSPAACILSDCSYLQDIHMIHG